MFHLHSELKVLELDNVLSNFHFFFSSNVIITTFDSCIKLFHNFHSLKRFFSLLVIPNCHKALFDLQFKTVVDFFYETDNENNHGSTEVHSNTKLPRILATTSSLLADQHLHPSRIEAHFEALEILFRADVIVAPGLIPLPVLTDNNLLLKQQQQLKLQRTEHQISTKDHSLNVFDKDDSNTDAEDVYKTPGTLYHSELITTQLTHPQEQVINCPSSTDHTGLVKKIDKFIRFTLHFVRTFDYANLDYLDKVLSKTDSDAMSASTEMCKEVRDGNIDSSDCNDKDNLKSTRDPEFDQKDSMLRNNTQTSDTQLLSDNSKSSEIVNKDKNCDKTHSTDRPNSPNSEPTLTEPQVPNIQQTPTTQQTPNEAPKKDLLQSVHRCLVECLDILHQLGPYILSHTF